MKPLIQSTTYPRGYNRKLIRGTKEWARAFSNWAMHIRSETMDEAIVYRAKEILK